VLVPPGKGRVTIGLVALGIKEGLPRAINAFREHVTVVDFDVVCVINDVSPEDPALATLPTDITVVTRRANLGYTGGLHLARAYAHGEFMVWGQDDMAPMPGWLDALVEAADASPGSGMVGSRQLDADGRTHPLNSGRTLPGQSTLTWPGSCDDSLPVRGSSFDAGWVSGAGALARLSAWDEVGGVDVRLWPLNYVDLTFCAHVRAHGFEVVHAPGARIEHAKHGSSTRVLLEYTQMRNCRLLDREGWPGVTEQLGETAARSVPHPCSSWLGADISHIAALQLEEASRAFLPLARHHSAYWADAEAYRAAAEMRIAELVGRDALLSDVLCSRSWRVTAPLRWIGSLLRRIAR
jgi:GT2 family glycosyltransferase